ncbi:MAG: WG repeat-containing protein [Oscillospiraceae bacterium]|nr:WG repeat-containing protein [Oscillospiraceae bacterium]
MDFFGQTTPVATPKSNNKKLIMFGMGGLVLVIVVIMVVMALISSSSSAKNNLIIDGVAKGKIDSTMLQVFTDDKTGASIPYVAVDKIAPLVGYLFYIGEYNVGGSEDKNYCYVQDKPGNNNTSNEVAMFEYDSSVVSKVLLSNPNMYDYYDIQQKVKYSHTGSNELYISLAMMQKAFNVTYKYDSQNNVLTISTMSYMANNDNTQLRKNGYKGISADFINKKALANGLIVFQSNDNKYGIINALDGSELYGAKYDSITYTEGTNVFLAKMGDKMGILNVDPSQNTDFAYNEMTLIDNQLNLYMVKDSNNKYGVIDKSGNIIVPVEYDYIGIKNPEAFPSNNITNRYVLFENCIPVQQGDKCALFDIKGNSLTPLNSKFNYGFGCVTSQTTGQNTSNVLLIPSTEGMEGIVVAAKGESILYTGQVNTTYGIVDAFTGKLVVGQNQTKIYVQNNEYYYVDNNNIVHRVKDMIMSTPTPANNTTNNTNDNNNTTTNNNTVQPE